jgi:ArsR family transcriptional regulator
MPSRKTPSAAECCPPDTAAPSVGPLDGPQADADLVAFAKAAGHPIRLQILRMLSRKDAHMCSHIVDELPLAQSTVSEHLRILRSAGLVRANEKGPRVSYCIERTAVNRFKALLGAL